MLTPFQNLKAEFGYFKSLLKEASKQMDRLTDATEESLKNHITEEYTRTKELVEVKAKEIINRQEYHLEPSEFRQNIASYLVPSLESMSIEVFTKINNFLFEDCLLRKSSRESLEDVYMGEISFQLNLLDRQRKRELKNALEIEAAILNDLLNKGEPGPIAFRVLYDANNNIDYPRMAEDVAGRIAAADQLKELIKFVQEAECPIMKYDFTRLLIEELVKRLPDAYKIDQEIVEMMTAILPKNFANGLLFQSILLKHINFVKISQDENEEDYLHSQIEMILILETISRQLKIEASNLFNVEILGKMEPMSDDAIVSLIRLVQEIPGKRIFCVPMIDVLFCKITDRDRQLEMKRHLAIWVDSQPALMAFLRAGEGVNFTWSQDLFVVEDVD